MNNPRINLVVIFGGRSGEHEVSLMSAQSVLSVLSPDKYNLIQIGIDHAGQWLTGTDALGAFQSNQFDRLTPAVLLPEPGQNWLYAIHQSAQGQTLEPLASLDVVFPVLHGTFGEDGTLQGLLELADLAYIGAGVLGSAVGMDKALFKDVMRARGIPVLDALVLTRHQIQTDMDAVLNLLGNFAPFPLFCKPANLGSSVGITKCSSRSSLIEGLLEAASYDRRVLVERGLDKPREIEVSVLGNDQPQASVPGEIIPSDDFYTYNAKYMDGASELIIPAPLALETAQTIRKMAVEVYRAIDCAGMARVDFLMDRQTGELFVNEVNTIPGFTQISMYPKLWEASGISYPELIDRLVALAMERKSDRDQTERRYGRTS